MSGLISMLRDDITRNGPMTFARYMSIALYHPDGGYYVGAGTGREPLGWQGDFITSTDVHPLWGWCMARQLHQMWQLMGQPQTFHVLEAGGGRGLLGAEVWRYARDAAPDWAESLRYVLLDRAGPDAPLRQMREQRLAARLAELNLPPDAVQWLDDASSAFATRSLTGCIVANELVDALPVHRLVKHAGELREISVDWDQTAQALVEVADAVSSPELACYLDQYGVRWQTYPDGWQCEVCLEAERWLDGMPRLVDSGFMLIVDYGALAKDLYVPERPTGTLLAYSQHRLNEHFLAHPGEQDLTAHVNFSALIAAARARHLRLAGFTTQANFLRGLGIREEAERLGQQMYPAAFAERHTDRGQADYLRYRSLLAAVATLTDTRGLGGFRVVALQRGVPGSGRRLQGFAQ